MKRGIRDLNELALLVEQRRAIADSPRARIELSDQKPPVGPHTTPTRTVWMTESSGITRGEPRTSKLG